MDDDLGTPAAVAAVYDVVREGNKLLAGRRQPGAAGRRLVGAGDARGARASTRSTRTGRARRRGREAKLTAAVDALVSGLLEQRAAARAAKDFATADAIRDQLKAAGIELEDTPQGPTWSL